MGNVVQSEEPLHFRTTDQRPEEGGRAKKGGHASHATRARQHGGISTKSSRGVCKSVLGGRGGGGRLRPSEGGEERVL